MLLPAYAHGGNCGCSLGSGLGAGPIITMPAYTLPEGEISIAIGTRYMNYGRLSASQVAGISARKQNGDDEAAALKNFVTIGYGVTDDLTVLASYPYTINFDVREVESGTLQGLGGTHGFGDLNLFVEYNFLKLDEHRLQAALLGGLNIPTGANNRSSGGQAFEPHFQPAAGAWNPSFGIALSKRYQHFNVDANFLYTAANDSSRNTNMGDSARYNLAISYPLNHGHELPFEHQHLEGEHAQHPLHMLEKVFPQHVLGQHLAWDLILEANVQAEDAPLRNDLSLDNHGGTSMFLSPGLRMTVNNKWFYNLSVGIPVLQALDGDQGGTDLQLLFSLGTTL